MTKGTTTFVEVDKYGSRHPPDTPIDIAILAGIGGVCMQWARLEMTALAVIGAFEQQKTEDTWLRYGGLDLLPRINLALRLSEAKGIPSSFAKRLRAVRRKVQAKDGLATRRNEVIHGAHKTLEGQTATLTMTRYPEGNRQIVVDPLSLVELAQEIHDAGDELWALFNDIWEWTIRQAGKAAE